MALIPPFFLDCVVAIGFDSPNGKRQYAATGFLYGKLLKQEDDKKYYQIFLVTNKHVVQDADGVWLRFNPETDESAREYYLPLINEDRKLIWFAHPDPKVDLAVVSTDTSLLKDQGIRFHAFLSDLHVANRRHAKELGVSEGDGVFVLGFPMGLIGEKRNFVIVRQGVIARIRDAFAGANREFLIDTTIFPGNSGGPVVTRPEFMSIQGTKAVSKAFLLGVVAGYIPYRDVAISTQTRQTRVIFEENSGLAAVVPIDYVIEVIEIATVALQAQRQETPVRIPSEDPNLLAD